MTTKPERLSDEQLAHVAARIVEDQPKCHACNGRGYVEGRFGYCSICDGIGFFALGTQTIRSIVDELRELRALLATPWPHEISQPPRSYDTEDPRVIFRLHRANHIVATDHAIALGAALVRAGLAARGGR